MTRRRLLGVGGAASLAAVLAACGPDDDAGSTSGPGPTTPRSTTPSTTTPSTSAAPSATTAPPPATAVVMDDATRATLDRIFAEQFAATGLAGLAGAVRIGDDEWSGSAGVADLATGEPYRPTDFVRIASITKTFTATAVLRLVDEGVMSLDDVLSTYVPGVINGDVATIADLLGMRSGIPDFTANAAFLEAFTADPTLPWTDADTLAVIAEAPGPDFAPGDKTAYCDSNYVLLAMAMQAVTDEPAGATITRTVIEPLGLTSTSYPTTAAMPDPHPTAYLPVVDPEDPGAGFDNMANPPRVIDDVNPTVAGGAGAAISTLADLQAWGQHLVEGALLSPELHAKRMEFHRFDGVEANIGYGLGVLNINEFVGHNGAIFGYSSVVLTRPQTGMQLTFVANEATVSTSSTLNVALAVIRELAPDQLS